MYAFRRHGQENTNPAKGNGHRLDSRRSVMSVIFSADISRQFLLFFETFFLSWQYLLRFTALLYIILHIDSKKNRFRTIRSATFFELFFEKDSSVAFQLTFFPQAITG